MATERPIDLDGLTLDGVRAGVLRGRRVAVLGAARSGIGLVRFFVQAGAFVTLYDARPPDQLAEAESAIEALEVAHAPGLAPGSGPLVDIVAGPDVDPAVAFEGAALVATSPSINPDYPTTEPRLRAALRHLVDAHAADATAAPALVSEADLFLRLCPAPTIGVTGTKGKTTTSTLAAAVLAADPSHPVELGGNIGRPLVELLPTLGPDHRVVIELSELQLPTLSRGTTVAVYTNVTSDHLDRHGTLEAYRRVKRRLAELVDPAGALVLNADDPTVAAYASSARARVITYRGSAPPPGGLGIVEDWIVADGVERLAALGGGAAATGPGGRILPVGELAIPGRHNVANAMAATAVGLLFGVDPDAIRRAATAFTGVEHRLETVATIDGVRFVNDSQGTQPDAVIAALRAYSAPIVLIAGGRDKEIDLSALAPVVAERAAGAILIGESGPALERLFRSAGLERTERAATLEDAVGRADGLARALAGAGAAGAAGGDGLATVLLSPAAASFDMFVDYAARGRAFKAAVAALAARRAAIRGADR
ncbi:MAG TPA: UDP-N-acetylmuramoyl-L-alanine--D-glutamate ligase [Candidatus Limnocylindrales bacterium]